MVEGTTIGSWSHRARGWDCSLPLLFLRNWPCVCDGVLKRRLGVHGSEGWTAPRKFYERSCASKVSEQFFGRLVAGPQKRLRFWSPVAGRTTIEFFHEDVCGCDGDGGGAPPERHDRCFVCLTETHSRVKSGQHSRGYALKAVW